MAGTIRPAHRRLRGLYQPRWYWSERLSGLYRRIKSNQLHLRAAGKYRCYFFRHRDRVVQCRHPKLFRATLHQPCDATVHHHWLHVRAAWHHRLLRHHRHQRRPLLLPRRRPAAIKSLTMKLNCLAVSSALALILSLPVTALAASGPSITTQPQSQSVLTGSNATFTVVAGGSLPLSYQWSFNGVNLTNSSHIKGATTTTLTVSNITVADGGNYQVIVSNSHGTIASSNALLTVLVPAAIASQPANQSTYFGGPASFSVSA